MIDKKHPRIVRIENSLALEHIWVSEILADEVLQSPHMELEGEPEPWPFNEDGNLW